MKLNDKEKLILSAVIGSWGIILIGSGIAMNNSIKPIIKTNYELKTSTKHIAQSQAKTNEIKLKDITIEINTPISVDVKDYLENINDISEETIKKLKLDTSLVNINQANTYQYTVTYKKKKYIANIIVKEKQLPNVTFTLKTITLNIGDALSTNPRSYIEETITDEVLNNITLDLSEVNNQTQNNYDYYIIYNGTRYQGKIEIKDPGPTIITRPGTEQQPQTPTETTPPENQTTTPTT